MGTRGETARQKILDVSAGAFSRFGYEGTRLDEVARTLGVTRQALLFHFKDKRGLYEASMEHIFQGREEGLNTRSREEFEQLPHYVDYLVDYSVKYYLGNPEYSHMLLRLLLGEGPVADRAPQRGRSMVDRWEAVLGECHEKGLALHVHVHNLVAIIGGSLTYYLLLPRGAQTGIDLMNYDPLTQEQAADMTASLQGAVRGLLQLSSLEEAI